MIFESDSGIPLLLFWGSNDQFYYILLAALVLSLPVMLVKLGSFIYLYKWEACQFAVHYEFFRLEAIFCILVLKLLGLHLGTFCVLLCQISISYNLLPYNILRHAQTF